MPDYV
jgi:hypothetical protein